MCPNPRRYVPPSTQTDSRHPQPPTPIDLQAHYQTNYRSCVHFKNLLPCPISMLIYNHTHGVIPIGSAAVRSLRNAHRLRWRRYVLCCMYSVLHIDSTLVNFPFLLFKKYMSNSRCNILTSVTQCVVKECLETGRGCHWKSRYLATI